jgi:hypothetical protein
MTGLYSQFFLSDPIPTSYAMSTLFPQPKSLHFDTPAQATFEANPKHGTIVGTIHEGCQAVLMELVGRQTALYRLAVPFVELTLIQVNYLAAAPSMNGTTLDIQALGGQSVATASSPVAAATTTLHTQSLSALPSSCTLLIQIKRRGEGTIVSEGTLTFKATTSSRTSLSTSAHPTPLPSSMTTLMSNGATAPRALVSGGGGGGISNYPTFNKNRLTATSHNNHNGRRWGSASASGFEPSRQYLPNYDFTENSVCGDSSSLLSFETAPSAFHDHRSYATAPTNLGGGVGHFRSHQSKTTTSSWEGLPPSEQYSPTASNMSVCSSGGSLRLTMDGSISSSPPAVNFSSREHFQRNSSIETRVMRPGGIGGEQFAQRDESSEDNPQHRSTMMPNLLVSSSPPAAAAAAASAVPPTLYSDPNGTSGGVKYYPTTTTTAAVGVAAARRRQSRSLGSTSVASLGQESSGTNSSNEHSIPPRRF